MVIFVYIFFLLYIDRQKVLQICEVFISFDVNYYVFLFVIVVNGEEELTYCLK